MIFFRKCLRALYLLSVIQIHHKCSGAAIGNSLYDLSDPIKLLDVHNFKETIVDKPFAWLVEFYSSWCGHCISFAPTFKQLAANVSGWSKVISVAALDCAEDQNGPICREYEVMAYPTLKLFPPHSNATFLGTQLKGPKTVEKIKLDMIQFVEKQQKENDLPHFPVLTSVGDETLEELWATYPESTETLLLLFETSASDDTWSREVILDLTQFDNFPPMLRVGVNRQDLLNKFNIKSLPVVAAINREGLIRVTSLKPDRFKAADVIIKEYSANRQLPKETKPEKPKSTEIKEKETEKVWRKDQVYMVDLEKAVQYALGHEVPLHKSISGESFTALTGFVRLLAQYFPGRFKVVSLLKKLDQKLSTYPGEISGEEFSVTWDELRDREIPQWTEETKEWRGCKGSQPNRRGYPCSLWTLFHTLTVSHASHDQSEPQLVLQTMKKYIKNFFGCAECAKHFVAMTEDPVDSIEKRVTSPESSVLWLWEAHNKANKRLAGDATEDPQFPKIQFPSARNCPMCKDTKGQFRQDQVYVYLSNLYSKRNINTEDLIDSAANDESNRVHVTSGAVSMHRISLSFVTFTRFDISLCVVLYVACCLILLVVLCKFVVKRRYRRKSYFLPWSTKI